MEEGGGNWAPSAMSASIADTGARPAGPEAVPEQAARAVNTAQSRASESVRGMKVSVRLELAGA